MLMTPKALARTRDGRRSQIIGLALHCPTVRKKEKRKMENDNPGDKTEAPNKKFTVDNHAQDKVLFANNEYAIEINKGWFRNIEEDIYIQEAFSVLCDLINLQQAKTKN